MGELLTKSITKGGALLGLLISAVGMLPSLAAYCFDRLRTNQSEPNFGYTYLNSELTGNFTYSYAAQGSVAFRTNGMQGGDAGHGGYLEVELNTRGRATDLYVSINGKKPQQVDKVALTWRGDDEMRGASDSLAFLARNLTSKTLETLNP